MPFPATFNPAGTRKYRELVKLAQEATEMGEVVISDTLTVRKRIKTADYWFYVECIESKTR